MNGITAVLVFVTVVSGASGACSNTSLHEAQDCLFESWLVQPISSVPTDQSKITNFCDSQKNGMPVCLETLKNDCMDDEKQSMILALVLGGNATTQGIMNLCDKAAEVGSSQCAGGLGSAQFTTCLSDAVGTVTDMESTDIKTRLDTLCKFFSDWRGCFSSTLANCSDVGAIYSSLYQGIEYPYCKLSDADKKARLDEIVSSAAPLSLSLLASLLAVFASFWLL